MAHIPTLPQRPLEKNDDGVHSPPKFAWSHLWSPAVVNPINLKSYTMPIFNLYDPYARAFHLSWLGFFVAFLSWFAFPPLIPDAIKSDLKLTDAQVANSNIIALAATLIVRFLVGPMVDQYGPRKVMASILIIGAIPSGLAGTAHNASTLYALRFFIGILGGTFVPCQAWTSAWFDKSVVGTANAFVGGWGNMGGGATFAIMSAVYQALLGRGLSQHIAWRASFAIIPAPALLFVAVLTLVFGQDHPVGTWSERHNIPASRGLESHSDRSSREEKRNSASSDLKDLEDQVTVDTVEGGTDESSGSSIVDSASNEPLTLKTAVRIIRSPITWLPALGYLTTFGVELAIDGKMADVLFGIFNQRLSGFDQTRAGYYTSIFGFLNFVARPLGGYLGDRVYRSRGTKGKKYLTLLCGIIMGVSCLAGGFYLTDARAPKLPHLPTVIGIFSVTAIFAEIGNGANFALVPHCNPQNNGVMSGIAGSCGNLGGIIFALVFRFQTKQGKAFWIMGIISIAINLGLVAIPVPKY